MVDLMILSPAFLASAIQWAGAVVTVFAASLSHPTKDVLWSEEQ